MSVIYQSSRNRTHALERGTRTAVPSARTAMLAVCQMDLLVLVVVVRLGTHSFWSWWPPALVAAVLLLLLAMGHYRRRITLGGGREFGSLVACVMVPFVGLTLLAPASTTEGELLSVGLAASLGLVAERWGSYTIIRALRRRGWFVQRTLLVGAGPMAVDLASVLGKHPEYGLLPIGFIDDVEDAPGADALGLPLFRGVRLLRMVIFEERVERIVIAFGAVRDERMVEVLRACEGSSVTINVLPRLFELGLLVAAKHADDVWGYRLIELRGWRVRQRARLVKRGIDTVVALSVLLIVSPLYVLLALAVKLSSIGPVHFRQIRVGQNERQIEVLKLRTLPMNHESDVQWIPDADEVGRLGRFLRVTGLDEIPQLWNIVRGDMSLVGPRPERPFFVDRFKAEIPRYSDRHRVPPGLTGLAQIHGLRGDTPMDERVRLDNQYIENWSLWQDLVILVSTIGAVLRNIVPGRRAASAGGSNPTTIPSTAVGERGRTAVAASAGGRRAPG